MTFSFNEFTEVRKLMLVAFFFYIKVIIPEILKDEGPGKHRLILGFNPDRDSVTLVTKE